MLEVSVLSIDELTEEEKENVCADDYHYYLKVTHKGKEILFKSDAMEPEDCTFMRDLSWISSIINRAYRLGVEDGYKIQG